MYQRIIQRPNKSFFLFGPRGTGKSTWLKSLKFDYSIDLLNAKMKLDLLSNPHHLTELLSHLPKKSWVLIDEVQKVPEILDEVHALYEEKSFNFALSGSSARKIKRVHGNLLAGRAINCSLFSLVFPEYETNLPLDQRIEWGTLPLTVDNFMQKEDTLDSYINNYLTQELLEEGHIRKLEPFSRFLRVAGIMNGQILNVESVARDCKVSRTTVDQYFNILFETLIAFKLPAYQPGIKVKEIGSPKFYFFDSGVARACAGLTNESLDRSYKGFLFETFLLNEIRAFNSYFKRNRDMFHYTISNSFDIDLLIQLEKKTVSKPDKIIAIEIKSSQDWKDAWSKTLESFLEAKSKIKIERLIGVYQGKQRLRSGKVDVFPVDLFLKELFDEKFF